MYIFFCKYNDMILQKSRNRLFVCSELPDHRPPKVAFLMRLAR